MDDNTTAIIDSKLILEQARDTLAMTYWCTGAEFVGRVYDEDELEQVMPASLPSKFIKARVGLGGDTNKRYRLIESVCSIGAMSLARHMDMNTPIQEFGSYESADWDSFRAALVLLRCIVDSDQYPVELNERPSSGIASWNDSKSQFSETDRGEVIAMFDKAAEHPLVKADSLWVLQLPDTSNQPFYVAFGSEKEAQEGLDEAIKAYEAKPSIDEREIWEENLAPWLKSLNHTGYLDEDTHALRPLELTRDNFADLISY